MPLLEDEETSGTRVVYINRFQTEKFVGNSISTAKYNIVTFLPRFLFEQFRRYANIFFLTIALLQQIPDVSPTGRYTTAVPLVFILSVSALKEIIEDWKRHMADRKVNNRKVMVLKSGSWVETRWKKVKVGDMVKILDDQFFPADIVILSSSEPQAMAYIETSNLDGETNLKIRQGHPETAGLLSHEQLYEWGGTVECEQPNRHLYEFSGNLRPQGAQPFPLSNDQLLLRGARLKNTNWAFGIVIYTGHDSKLMKNTNKAPLKRSNVDKVTNNQILVLFVVLLVMSLISAIAAQIWADQFAEKADYLGIASLKSTNFGYSFLTFIILYNNLIPISLQVTLEVVRFIQAIFINYDLDMYHEESDQPAMARTSNLNEELGQVKYVFADKTGTLTKNVMTFKKCSVAGFVYGSDSALTFDDRAITDNLNSRHVTAPIIREFLNLMAVCHTVVPEKRSSDGKVEYQASSPDEGALVRGANNIGFVFHTRTPEAVFVNAQGREEQFDILNVLEFTSERKMMGVIVRASDGRIKLYSKGADMMIYEKLAPNQLYKDVTLRHLEEFAGSGYRTLCLAKADISEEFYAEWKVRFHEASIAIDRREAKLAAVAEEIEQNLTLLGATAIEDRLQEGVPETIAALLKADVKVWILTGDKQETAINIGHSCKLLSPNMPLMIINKNDLESTRDCLRRFVEDLGPAHLHQDNDLALIIDGKSLMYALTGELRRDFQDLAISCRSVICCRATPMQKAEVVDMIKKSVGAITLAIGDGANDVAMIQAAHVGIGISGQEGLQAACASDYAIAQFRFLAKLMFVHGAWSFHRMVKMILYSFHKNICLYIIEFWFAIVSGWSGQTLFERWCIGLYNVIFTAAPPLAIGLFDRTASAETMLRFPALYKLSQDKSSFSVKIFWLWIMNAIYHSILLFFLSKLMLADGVAWDNGRTGGWLMLGNCVYTYVVVTVCLKAGLEVDAWTWLTHLAIWGSMGSWFVFLLVYCNFWPLIPLAPDMSGMDQIMYSSPVFWLGLFLIPTTTLLIDYVYKIVRRTLFKTVADEVRELELSHVDPSLIIPKLTRRRWMRRRRSQTTDPLTEHAAPTAARTRDENSHLNPRTGSHSRAQMPHSIGFRLSETARLLRNVFRRSPSGNSLSEQAQHGYAFSQEESGVVPQGDLIRAYDSTQAKPEGR